MVQAQVSKVQAWRQLAQQLRVDSIRCTTAAGSGHPTSSMSAADIMAVLATDYLRYDFDQPAHPNNDRLVFSKGHACPLLYAFYKAAGAIDDKELLSLRRLGSRLEGHPVPKVLPWVEVATGSLGQGICMSVGMAMEGKYLEKLPYKVWVILGDSEMAEGSVWEALNTASFYKLDNLVCIIDMNRLGQRGPTELQWDSGAYAERARAFGCHAIEIDGHDCEQIDRALKETRQPGGKPVVIIAKTEKGHGFSEIANKENWHGKPLNKEQAEAAIAELGGLQDIRLAVQKPVNVESKDLVIGKFVCPEYSGSVATREAYGDALKALGAARQDVVVLDAEVGNSTYSEKFKAAFPDRFFEMYIAEQQMVGAAIGMAVRGRPVFASTFAAFLTRAYDFIRMAAVSRSKISLCGSHAGVSIGQDGPSQMALEDLSMMRAIHSSTVLYPSDAVCAAKLVNVMADLPGVSYLRTTREKTPILYKTTEEFPVGGSKVLRQSDKDRVTIIAAGITLHEALKAYEQLKEDGVNARIIDLYSVKPVDVETLRVAAADTGLLIVVEDHNPEGGMGDAVLDAFSDAQSPLPRVLKLAVRIMPGSASPDELLDQAGINAKHIVEAVKKSVP